MYELGDGQLRTSDVTGMDWSVGALGGSHGFITLLSAEKPSAEYIAAVTASTWASYNSVYHIGDELFGQTRLGSVQTGMLCTSQEGGAARVVDSILKNGVIDTEEGLKPAKAVISYSDDKVLAWGGKEGRKLVENYRSPLDERDILCPKRGEPIDFLGRFFQSHDDGSVRTLRYELKRWENSIASVVEPRIIEGELSEDNVALTAQRISAFRHENRHCSEALEVLEKAISAYNLSVPDSASKCISPVTNFDGNIDNHTIPLLLPEELPASHAGRGCHENRAGSTPASGPTYHFTKLGFGMLSAKGLSVNILISSTLMQRGATLPMIG